MLHDTRIHDALPKRYGIQMEVDLVSKVATRIRHGTSDDIRSGLEVVLHRGVSSRLRQYLRDKR